MTKIHAQLYSVRDYLEKDFMATLENLKEMGYDGVEFAGYYNFDAQVIREKLDELGLECVSAHVPLELLENDLDHQLEILKTLGGSYIVCPYAEVKSKSDIEKLAKSLNRIGAITKEAGLPLCYHNHSHEFVMEDDQLLIDYLYELVDEGNLLQQPDLYWVAHAGLDPLEYMEKHLDRCPMIHLKQMKDMDSKENVSADQGMIDFGKAIDLKPQGIFIYEQETRGDEILPGMDRSVKYLKGF